MGTARELASIPQPGTVTTIIAAIASAIILGINATDAAKLPGKLATLIDTANATTPDAATLVSSSDATPSFFGLFVAATTPMPSLDSCDNSQFLAPGNTRLMDIGTDAATLTSSSPCLNPTAIPGTTPTDPQFLVKAQGQAGDALALDHRQRHGDRQSDHCAPEPHMVYRHLERDTGADSASKLHRLGRQ